MTKEEKLTAAFLRGAARASRLWKGNSPLEAVERMLRHLDDGTDEERAEFSGVLAHTCYRSGLERAAGLATLLGRYGVTRAAFLESLGKAGGHE